MFYSWSTDGQPDSSPVCGHQRGEWHSPECYANGRLRSQVLAGLAEPAPAPFSGVQCGACAVRTQGERCGACPMRSPSRIETPVTRSRVAARRRPGWRGLLERLLR